ncbi:hypothetical protein [Glutamicibacter ardleyensis]|uniref:hypothetical protein n=1 Tax=Glutamicibacter ardleyensis TaxID=225894 RepID=UPI003FD24685
MAITLHLTDEQVQGLKELIDFANRGHEDFLQQSQYGDFTPEEFQEREALWMTAKRAEQSIAGQISSGQDDPVMETVEKFTKEAVSWVEDDIWGKAQCSEVELAAQLYTFLGMPHVAEVIIVVHSQSDTDAGDMHHEYYDLSLDEKYALYRAKQQEN